MNKRELELAAILLKMASDEFSNHGCNDLDLPPDWTREECDKFTLALDTWNGSPQDNKPGKRSTMDSSAMAYLAAMLKLAAKTA